MSRSQETPEAEAAENLRALFASGQPYAVNPKQRKSELKSTVRQLRSNDSPEVWNHSRPLVQYRLAADNLAKEIAGSLTEDMARTNASSDQQMRAQRFGNWLNYVRTGRRDERKGYGPIRDFLNYCAYLIGIDLRGDCAASLAEAENRRLILPFEASGSALIGSDDGTMPDIALYTQGVGAQDELQNNPHYATTSHIIECKWYPNDFLAALNQLAGYVLHMFRNQHDRRYAIGITICGTVVKIIVFAHDSILVSTDADIAVHDGRETFIRQLVDWSICSRDKLGLDTTIQRRVLPTTPLTIQYQIDINRTHYYSRTCIQVTDTLFGRRRRCFLLSDNADDLDNTTHILIDEWSLATKRQRHDTGDEANMLGRLHETFANNNDLHNKYPQLVRAERVRQKQGVGTFTEDNTVNAYGALHKIRPRAALADDDWEATHHRAHKHMLIIFSGTAISQANNVQHVFIAIVHAMTMHDAVYTQLGILHSDISAANILHQIVEGEVLGVLAGFSYAIDTRAEHRQPAQLEMAAIRVIQSIRSLEDAEAIRTRLDDWESLLYLVCWLGTFGINRVERMAYLANYTARCREGRRPRLPILWWSQGDANDIADRKRSNLSTPRDFEEDILSHMRCGPLRRLAADIYRALFLHPGCSGTKPGSYLEPTAHHVAPTPGGERDPLALRNGFEDLIVRNLLQVLLWRGNMDQVILGIVARNIAGGVEEGAGA